MYEINYGAQLKAYLVLRTVLDYCGDGRSSELAQRCSGGLSSLFTFRRLELAHARPRDFTVIGITDQRETTIVRTGRRSRECGGSAEKSVGRRQDGVALVKDIHDTRRHAGSPFRS
jgi:hypothetical protein